MNTYPGMYCECEHLRVKTDTYLLGVLKVLEESLLVPGDTLAVSYTHLTLPTKA